MRWAADGVKENYNFEVFRQIPAEVVITALCARQQIASSQHQSQYRWQLLRLRSTMRVTFMEASKESAIAGSGKPTDSLGFHWNNWTNVAVVLMATFIVCWVARKF